jgi:hypothetical protein
MTVIDMLTAFMMGAETMPSTATNKDTSAIDGTSVAPMAPQPQGTLGTATNDQRLSTFRATTLAIK